MLEEINMFLKMPPETIKIDCKLKGMLTEIKNAEKELKLVKKWYKKCKNEESERELKFSLQKYRKKVENFVNCWNKRITQK